MATDWDDILPQWRKEGRTGPGPAAPKFKKAKDRAKVRRGQPVTNSNPGGPGGKRKKIQTNKPQGKTSHRKEGGGSSFVEDNPRLTYALMAWAAFVLLAPVAVLAGGIVLVLS